MTLAGMYELKGTEHESLLDLSSYLATIPQKMRILSQTWSCSLTKKLKQKHANS